MITIENTRFIVSERTEENPSVSKQRQVVKPRKILLLSISTLPLGNIFLL